MFRVRLGVSKTILSFDDVREVGCFLILSTVADDQKVMTSDCLDFQGEGRREFFRTQVRKSPVRDVKLLLREEHPNDPAVRDHQTAWFQVWVFAVGCSSEWYLPEFQF